MHLILTGATGLVGSGVLDAMLKSDSVTKISILSRRKVPMVEHTNNPKVDVILHKDFLTYDPDVLERLRGAEGAVWALGISQTKVNKQDYMKITRDFPIAAANAFASLAPECKPFRFIYVSGGGANTDPTFLTPFYGRVKGETETILSELCGADPRLQTESVRPAGVDASAHRAVLPYIPDPGQLYRWAGMFYGPLFRNVWRSLHSPTEPLGLFLTEMAMGRYDKQLSAGAPDIITLRGGMRILDNWTFRRMAGLS